VLDMRNHFSGASGPCKVCVTRTFPAVNSAEQTDGNVDANHAMLELHTSSLRSVLHVPHTTELSMVKLA